jgi:hypothetical protein
MLPQSLTMLPEIHFVLGIQTIIAPMITIHTILTFLQIVFPIPLQIQSETNHAVPQSVSVTLKGQWLWG